MPFIGSSGKVLDKALTSIGIDPAKTYVCERGQRADRLKNRVPQVVEIAACSGYLFPPNPAHKPRVILTLGNDGWIGDPAARKGPVWSGQVATLDSAVMPTFHPAYLFRVSSARAAFEEDLRGG